MGGELQADHIIPFSYILNEFNIQTLDDARNCYILFAVNNGRTLCKPCHTETDTYGIKALQFSVMSASI
jgi:hypothetical protein